MLEIDFAHAAFTKARGVRKGVLPSGRARQGATRGPQAWSEAQILRGKREHLPQEFDETGLPHS